MNRRQTPIGDFRAWLEKLRLGLLDERGGNYVFLHLAICMGVAQGTVTLEALGISEEEWASFPRSVMIAACRMIISDVRLGTRLSPEHLDAIQNLIDSGIALEEIGISPELWVDIVAS